MLSALEYDLQDIGTLQTFSSQPIAINNEGQILGWYRLDRSKKHSFKKFFVRDRDGTFNEIHDCILHKVTWRHLSNDGQVYGTCDGNNGSTTFIVWHKERGIIELGKLPCGRIAAINDKGQALIESISGADCQGNPIRYPVIWHNGTITKLKGLEGDLGIESARAEGLDMNNYGDVVGSSVVNIVYKNNLYQQTHATKWVNGQAIDLHKEVPKCMSTSAQSINDNGDIVVNGYLIRSDGQRLGNWMYSASTPTASNYFLVRQYQRFLDRNGRETGIGGFKEFQDYDCIWLSLSGITGMNDHAEIIGTGSTIFGEIHAILLTPKN
jgi:uncharacterized membrane protein